MSIATEVTRIAGLRDSIKDKLIALGLMTAQDNAKLSDLNTVIGGIANKGSVNETLTVASPSYTVGAGLHSGSGTVQIVTETKNATPTTSAQDITPTTGKVLSKVTVAAIPTKYADVSSVTATQGDVLTSKVFVNSSSVQQTGTMPNNGAVNGSFNGIAVTSYTIPQGYHSGAGKVSLTSDIETALAAI